VSLQQHQTRNVDWKIQHTNFSVNKIHVQTNTKSVQCLCINKFYPVREGFSLIKSQKDILESKKTDSISVLRKKAAWAEVAEQFNAVSGGTKRDCKQLQCWQENQKKCARQNFADNHFYFHSTVLSIPTCECC